MNYFDTVAGHQFTEILMDSIPKLIKEQYTIRTKDKFQASKVIEIEIKKGNKYVNHIELNNDILIIFEK